MLQGTAVARNRAGSLAAPETPGAAATRARSFAVSRGPRERWGQRAGFAAAAAVAALLVLAALARLGPTPAGAFAAAVTVVLVALSAIDLRERRLPNRIVLPAATVALATQALVFDRALECLVAAPLAALVLALPLVFNRRAIGMGDVKLGLLLGAALGRDVVGALIVAGLAVGPVALTLLLLHGAAARRATLPFGPFLALGAVTMLVAVGNAT